MLGHQIDDPYNSFSTLLALSYSVWLLNFQFTLIHYGISYLFLLKFFSFTVKDLFNKLLNTIYKILICKLNAYTTYMYLFEPATHRISHYTVFNSL